MRLFRLTLFLPMVLLAVSCATNPATGKPELNLISEAQEIRIGEENYTYTVQAQGGGYRANPALVAYVNEVGQKLVAVSDRPGLPYEFVVINSDVPNAWALPGGKLAINRGLLMELESEAELAAVLAHEIAHVTARHSARRIQRALLYRISMAGISAVASDRRTGNLIVGGAKVGTALIQRRYSRADEQEADRYGMEYMAKAGYDPYAAVRLQEMFVQFSAQTGGDWLTGLLSTHPASEDRVAANRRMAEHLPQGGETFVPRFTKHMAHLFAAAPAYDALAQGRAALTDGKPDEALSHGQEAVGQYPEEAAFHALKGHALLAAERWDEAEQAFDAAIERDDDYFRHYLGRGTARTHLDRDEIARADLEKSIELLPTDTAHLTLGNLLLKSGDTEAAKRHLRHAEGDSAVGQEATTVLARLELEQVPGRYIMAGADLNPEGYVLLRVVNRSPLPVRDIQVQVTVRGDETVRARESTITFSQTLPPGKGSAHATTIGPLPLSRGTGLVQTRVISAKLAE